MKKIIPLFTKTETHESSDEQLMELFWPEVIVTSSRSKLYN